MTTDQVLELIRTHAAELITPAELAHRTGKSRGAVSNWFRRRQDFTQQTVAAQVRGTTIMWWPALKTWLTREGILFGEPAVKLSKQHTCLHCGGLILPGELETSIIQTGKNAGQVRFMHFIAKECQNALRRPHHNKALTGRFYEGKGV